MSEIYAPFQGVATFWGDTEPSVSGLPAKLTEL